MTNKIILWNIKGAKVNLSELLLFISTDCLDVICFQETFLKENEEPLKKIKREFAVHIKQWMTGYIPALMKTGHHNLHS